MLAFAADSFIGNLGAPLRVSEEDAEDDKDDEHELQDLEEELEQNHDNYQEPIINIAQV